MVYTPGALAGTLINPVMAFVNTSPGADVNVPPGKLTELGNCDNALLHTELGVYAKDALSAARINTVRLVEVEQVPAEV
jgi:hypothetical protein